MTKGPESALPVREPRRIRSSSKNASTSRVDDVVDVICGPRLRKVYQVAVVEAVPH
ncbi:hypothetical protein ACFV2U_54205 [Streptomyces sp. NPDC059697]|uniref:hypothetical protein n=1 Tax=Streptomyces sp. NPDC059697 TaxID=3346912 RepID=UPI0036AAF8B8